MGGRVLERTFLKKLTVVSVLFNSCLSACLQGHDYNTEELFVRKKTRIISVYRSIKHPVRFIRSHHSTTGGALTLCLPKHCDWKKTFSFFQNHLLQRRSTTGLCLLYAWLPWRKISSYHKSLVMFLIQLFKVATKGHCLRKTPSKHSTRLDFYWEARYSARSPWF